MRYLPKKKLLYPLITFVFTILVTSCVAYYVYRSQLEYTSSLIERLAEQQTANLQRVVESDLQFIGAGADFFHATKEENWYRFPLFAKQIISDSQTLIALEWMPRVEHYQVEQHLKNIRQVFPSYQIYTVPKNQPKAFGYLMPDNMPIYPVADIYPRDQVNLNILGFYSSRKRFQLILDGLRKAGQANVSDKVRLLQDGIDKNIPKAGLLIYHPVFSVEDKSKLIGVVIGVVRSTNYFDSLVTRTASEQELSIQVIDSGFDAEDDPILYQSDDWDNTDGIEITKRVMLPNREWILHFKLDRALTDGDRFVLFGIFIAGLVIGCLSSYIEFLLLRGQDHLESLLDERTQKLQFLVDHDALTETYNRRAFNRYLSSKISQQTPFALAGLDVDNFKLINDHYGHIAGDEVLCHVARLVEDLLQPNDIFVRVGGDEFCIISDITDKQKLEDYLTHIGQTVAHSEYYFDGKIITCSLSIGAAIHYSGSAEEIMQASDAELYKSKQAGRNRVSIAI